MTDDVGVTLPWVEQGTALVRQVLDGLDDAALAGPSALSGWSRGHVVAHLARNADALRRLLHWARTGEETPMYASPEQRDGEIAASAARPAADLRADWARTAEALGRDLAGTTGDAWAATVRTAQGRAVPAAQVPWMRVREVWLHAVDLDAGVGVDVLPDGLAAALLDDVTALLSTREGCPAVELRTPGGGAWRLGARGRDGATAPAVVTGTPAALAGWVTGRGQAGVVPLEPEDGERGGTARGAAGPALPALPRWL